MQQPEASHVARDRDGIGESVKVAAPATQKMHHEAHNVDDVGACRSRMVTRFEGNIIEDLKIPKRTSLTHLKLQ